MKMEILENNWLTDEGILEVGKRLRLFLNSDTKEGKAIDEYDEIALDDHLFFGCCCQIFNVIKNNDKSLKIEFEKYVDCTGEEGYISENCFTIISSFEELEKILTIDGFIHSDFNTLFSM